MISIITAIHNQLPVNRLFLESLQRYSDFAFELIIIDNASTDGSGEYFKRNGAKVITNRHNYSYPYTQNQGISIATGSVLAFLNNDIVVCPHWDSLVLETMKSNGLDVVTCCGVEQIEDRRSTYALRRRWNFIKNIFYPFQKTYPIVKLMHRMMYPNWEKFCAKRATRYARQIKEGFVGNSVFLSRRALELLGHWDERLQAADFDLYMRSKKRFLEKGDIRPCHIALDVFHHHYIRFTVKKKPEPFYDSANIIPFVEKWPEAERNLYMKDIELL